MEQTKQIEKITIQDKILKNRNLSKYINVKFTVIKKTPPNNKSLTKICLYEVKIEGRDSSMFFFENAIKERFFDSPYTQSK